MFIVLLMGFTESEARLGLRACQGDSTSAVEYITQRRRVIAEFNIHCAKMRHLLDHTQGIKSNVRFSNSIELNRMIKFDVVRS